VNQKGRLQSFNTLPMFCSLCQELGRFMQVGDLLVKTDPRTWMLRSRFSGIVMQQTPAYRLAGG